MSAEPVPSNGGTAPSPDEQTRRYVWLGAGALTVLAAAWLLYLFPPGSVWFYPQCMFHRLTGLDCPGCGGLRAAHQLLHGHWKVAFALNPLLFVVAPTLVWFGVAQVWRTLTSRELSHPFKHPAWFWALFAVVVVFGIVRNLPIPLLHPPAP
jgi:hypothetical protein